ncbi:hypothetical protein CVV38_02990 [Candidatus Peregrinibacteria bacterium HGW-Peregrinibacteria-1]|nr:MAG: hypothetical protein CVV38_02990 [Candidatus Peregrinibacteria bacterium HGW-Peregrinibacteria-1]
MIVELFVVAYLIYSLSLNAYRGYQVDKHIALFEAENQLLEKANQQKNEDFLYYISTEYADKIAKQNFGLINPGEEVIVVAADQNYIDPVEEQVNVARYQDDSNPKKWKNFIFGE